MSIPVKEDPHFQALVGFVAWSQVHISTLASLLQERGIFSSQDFSKRFHEMCQNHGQGHLDKAWQFVESYADPEQREKAFWDSLGIGDQWGPSANPNSQE